MKKIYIKTGICFLFIFHTAVFQAQKATPHRLEVKKTKTINPKQLAPVYAPVLKPIEMPNPDGDSYQSYLMRTKRDKVAKLYPRKNNVSRVASDTAQSPLILKEFNVIGTHIPSNNTFVPLTGGTPLDNTLAISNSGLLMTSINSKIYAHDTNADTALFKSGFSFTFSFEQFAQTNNISTDFPFDPKLIYDPISDRFILVYLSGRDEKDSKIIVCFSSTNNPVDEWYIYEVPGNPRNKANWSDYPALSITENHLFITMNMIIPGVSWQLGFDGSIIWQINLKEGYAGATALPMIWWDDIKYNGKYIRNLHPIKGATKPLNNEAFFISNRNFDLINDTIFLVKLENTDTENNASLSVMMGKLDTPYGMPPNGRQKDTDTTDASKGLQTNDARWLGGILLEDKIQFVGNTINHANGHAAVYHGFIENVRSNTPVFTGNIISDNTLDFGYPNIMFAGKDECESQTIIAFNYSSITDFAGNGCVYFSNEKKYSKFLRIRQGENYVDNFGNNDSYERWGDYFGIQRKYNTPGEIWTSGFFALSSKKSSVNIARLKSPDSTFFSVQIDTTTHTFNLCDGEIMVSASGGIAPHSFFWQGNTIVPKEPLKVNLCDGSYTLEVADNANCKVSYTIDFNNVALNNVITVRNGAIFPNPFSDRISLAFDLENEKPIQVEIIDTKGALVKRIENLNGLKGLNEFSISTEPLLPGVYFIKIYSGESLITEDKLVKVS